MGASDEARTDQIAHGILHGQFARNVEPGRHAFLAAMADFQKMGRTHFISDFADEDDHIAGTLEKLRCDVQFVFDQADHRHRRSRIDDSGGAFII